ncbi:hypothetical protein VTJ04DRAFT_10688 [Mycothermus thermophilus]|uniref:uncharacterized protein n=1 Tax=Humicola insolens TaxID=85995 RepID=UPI003742CCC2
MGKAKMDEAAAARIRRARGDKDGFSKRAADAARRNEQSQGGSGQSGSGQGGSSSSRTSSGGSSGGGQSGK